MCKVDSTRQPVSAAVERDADRLEIAHFADRDHVGVLPQGGPQPAVKVLGVAADLPLAHEAFLVGVQILDGVFDRDHVPLVVRVDVVDDGGHRGRLALAGAAGQQHQALGGAGQVLDHFRHAQLVEGSRALGENANHGAGVAVERAHVDAIAAVVVDGHEVEVAAGQVLLPLVVAQQLERQPLALLRGQRLGRGRNQPPRHAEINRRPGATWMSLTLWARP